MEKRIYRAGEVLVKIALAHDKVADRPQIVKKQVVKSLWNERKAVDEHNLVVAPASEGWNLTEYNCNKNDTAKLCKQQTDCARQEVALIFHKSFKLLHNKTDTDAKSVSKSNMCGIIRK